MASNVEIKARVADLDAIRQDVLTRTAHRGEVIDQRDTFFKVSRGRLKLREFGDGSGELIFYERPDQMGPKHSQYWRAPAGDPQSLSATLAAAFGIRGVVEKRRLLFLVGQTRVHLDDVRDLGTFVELEVVLGEGQPVAEGQRIARALMTELRIGAESLEPRAYIDLLESLDRPTRGLEAIRS
jgi:adenylate cyclase class IV